MPALRVKQNAVFRALDDYMIEERRPVDCRLKDGDYRPMVWGGFISMGDIGIRQGRMVKLRVYEYTEGNRFSGWSRVQAEQHVLGCVAGNKAYGVLQDEHVVIIP
ncbi:MAG: hypothetical protein ACI92E_001753 [Oceanicoccus sp.]|jgi:hypothetical protein